MSLAGSQEQTVWSKSPSQILNLARGMRSLLSWGLAIVVWMNHPAITSFISAYLFPVGLGWLAIAIGILLLLDGIGLAWACLNVSSTVYTLTEERFIVQRGVINRRTDTLELYRVIDVTVFEPLLTRLVGAGDVVLISDDPTTPTVRLKAIHQPLEVMASIRRHAEQIRQRRRLLLVDNQ
ncbi:MAG: PH domain-containing protein [Synechococcus sp.]